MNLLFVQKITLTSLLKKLIKREHEEIKKKVKIHLLFSIIIITDLSF